MNVLQVGLGDFGFSWLKEILLGYDGIRIAGLVDKNPELLKKGQTLGNFSDCMLFTDLHEALSTIRPDFILNITPPYAHKAVDIEAFEHGIPVLSEKPVAEDFKDVIEIVRMSGKFNVPLMIAENYRYYDIVRKTREIIASAEVGQLNAVYIDFFMNHRKTNYHKDLKYPLLLDVSIHHLDMLRYLTGSEATEVFAKTWNPTWSWYNGYPNLDLLIEMENDVKASYRGSLTAQGKYTSWLANWRMECSKGVVELDGKEIRIIKNNQIEIITITEEVPSQKKVLAEFIRSLDEKRPGETDINDNVKTFFIVQSAIQSIEMKTTAQIFSV